MGYRRRRRYPTDPLHELMVSLFSLVVGVSVFAFLFWVFSQPSAWKFTSGKPTVAPTVSPVSVGFSVDWVLLVGVFAMLLGAGGLLVLAAIILISSQNRRKRQKTSIAQTGTFSSTVMTNTPIGIERSQEQVITPRVEQYSTIPPIVDDDDELRLDARPIMYKTEQAFFFALLHAVRDDYYIFPQVPLKEFLPSDVIANAPRNMFSMCQDGIVDYVLADPNTLSGVVGFELDDSSHDQAYTKTKDRRKESLLKQSGIPLLRSRVGETWDSALLRQEIEQAAPSSVPRVFLADSERNFFQLLRDALKEHFIFPKIRLKLLIHSENRLPPAIYKTIRNNTVDFVIGHQRYLGALLAIELRDKLAHDQAKQNLLRSANIPLLCYDAQNPPTAAQLRQQIMSEIRANRERK
jgi:hypothetical protein